MTSSVATPGGKPLAIGGLLALAMAAGPLINHGFTALSPLLVADLDLSASSYGALWTVIYGVAAVVTIAGGGMADRVAHRLSLVLVFVTAALGLTAAGLADGYGWLVVAAVMAGLSQAFAAPVTNQVVSYALPARSWGLALGMKQSGVQVAQFLTGAALPTIALWWGRDVGFFTLALLSLVGILFVRGLVPAHQGRPEATTAARDPLPVHVTWLTAYAFVAGASQQAVNVHLPLYAHDVVGLPVARAGLVVAAVGALGIVSRLIWGRGAGRIADVRVALQWVGGLGVGSASIFLAATWGGEWLLWVGATVFSGGALAANVLIALVVVRIVPKASVGRASGRAAGALFLGFMAGPVLFGMLVDGTGGYTVAWVSVAVATAVMGAMTVVWRRLVPAEQDRPD